MSGNTRRPVLARIGGKISNPGSSLRPLILLAAILLLLWLVARRFAASGFEFATLQTWILRAQLHWLAASWALVLVAYLWRALRWRVLVLPLNPRISTWEMFSCTAMGFAALMLFGRAAEFVRPLLIARRAAVSLSSQLACWVLERTYDLLCLVTLFGVCAASLSDSSFRTSPKLAALLSAGGSAAAVAAGVALTLLFVFQLAPDVIANRLRPLIHRLPDRLGLRFELFLDSAVGVLTQVRSPRTILLLLTTSAGHWLTMWLCFRCLFNAFPETSRLGGGEILVFLGLVSLGTAIQLPGIGGGYQLVSILVLTDVFRLPVESAAGFALVSWITSAVVIVPVGLGFALLAGTNLWKMRYLDMGENT